MPNIFDNISQQLLPTLRDSLGHSTHADFRIGYFNLRGWQELADSVEHFEGGDGGCCRVLIGMHRSGLEEVRQAQRFDQDGGRLDNGQVKRLARELAQEFREQLTIGASSNADERVLRQLAAQIRGAEGAGEAVSAPHPAHQAVYVLP